MSQTLNDRRESTLVSNRSLEAFTTMPHASFESKDERCIKGCQQCALGRTYHISTSLSCTHFSMIQLLYCKLFIAFLSKCWGHPGSEQRRKPSWESSTQPPGWILRVQEELNLTKACDLLFSYHFSDPFQIRKHSVSQSQFFLRGMHGTSIGMNSFEHSWAGHFFWLCGWHIQKRTSKASNPRMNRGWVHALAFPKSHPLTALHLNVYLGPVHQRKHERYLTFYRVRL